MSWTLNRIGLGLALALVFGWGANAQETTLKAGDKAPDFTATATDGTKITLDTFKDADLVVVVFTCNTCPVAIAYEDRLIEFVKQFGESKVALVAINNHRSEDLDQMKERAKEKGFNFTYCYEGSGDSARAYGATVTPHCFVLDKDRKLIYQGAFDNSQKDPSEHYVAEAVSMALAGKPVPVSFKPAFGCSIKFATTNGK